VEYETSITSIPSPDGPTLNDIELKYWGACWTEIRTACGRW
jgi:hypothetical protein